MKVGLIILMVLGGAAVAEAQPSAVEVQREEEAEARERAEAAYDTAFILFEDEHAAHIEVRDYGYRMTGTVRTVRSAVPIRGIQRERLAPVDFYDAVGRGDLAGEFQSQQRKRLVIGGVSAGTFGLSVVFAGIAMAKVMTGPDFTECDVFSPTWQACNADVDRRARINDLQARNWGIGAGVAFVGSLVFAAIYRTIDPHPVSESERRMLAHDHNERLRRELRLPRKRPVSLSPFVSSEGGGVMAAGTF
jgi:hypothetical protein